MNSQEDFEKLPLKEKIIITASSQLVKHFRGLESSGMSTQEKTAKLIGCVRKLCSIARGDEIKEEVKTA